MPWGGVSGCITQEETQQMSAQIIVQEFLILQSHVSITGKEIARVCTHQTPRGITLKE